MNIKRGLNRIAIAISLIALFPGFYLSGEFFHERLKTESPEWQAEYQAWQKRYDERRKELKNEAKGLSKSELLARKEKMSSRRYLLFISRNPTLEDIRSDYVSSHLVRISKQKPRIKYAYPSPLKVLPLPRSAPPFCPFSCSSSLWA